MHRKALVLGLGLLGVCGAVWAQASLPTLLAAAIAQTSANEVRYAYDVTIESSRGTVRYTVDPSATGAARVRVLAPRESELSSEQRRAIERVRAEPLENLWCASRRLQSARDVRVASEHDGHVVYAFTPSAEQLGGPRGAEIARHLRAEATVLRNSPDISGLQVTAPAPFRVSLARIDGFSLDITCATAPNGRRYGVESITTIRGSALAQNFNERQRQRISNLRPVS